MGTMKKNQMQIGIKLLILIGFPWILFVVAFKVSPMYFFDGEYAYYEQNKEYSLEHEEYCRVLIIGDSTAKASWLPTLLSEDTYNYALGGASTVEEYYYLKEYLENNEKPEYVIYTISPMQLIEAGSLWSRSVYFHRLSKNDLTDLIVKSSYFSDDNEIISYKDMMDSALYYSYSPTKYGTALIMGMLGSRYDENIKKYNSVSANKGHIYFGTSLYCDEQNDCVLYKDFKASEMLDYYLRETIELCQEYDIKFVLQNAPMNTASFSALSDSFIMQYEEYIQDIQNSYPTAIIDGKLFEYGNENFGDSSHLNESGALKFTTEMKDKYRYIFEVTD